jgi:CBS domain-containing protein
MFAYDIMTKGVVSIGDTATVYEAAELMVSMHVSGLPVVDSSGKLVGLISEADIIGQERMGTENRADALLQRIANDVSEAAAFVKANSLTVRDVMTRNVVTIPENTSLPEIATMMLQRRVKRLPVMRGSQIVGMVSRINLVQALLAHGEPTPPGKAKSPAPPEAAPPSDAQLEDSVDAAIKAFRWSSARTDVTVLNGVVHLWGVVADQTIRRAYLVAIEKVPGIKDIVDHTHVITPLVGGR